MKMVSLIVMKNEAGEQICHRCSSPVTFKKDAESVVCFPCVARKIAEHEANPEYIAEMKRIRSPNPHPYRMMRFFVQAHLGKTSRRKFAPSAATDYYIEATLKGATKRRKRALGP